MTIQEARRQLTGRLKEIYPDSEAENISSWAIEHITGLDRKSRLNDLSAVLTSRQTEQLEETAFRLMKQEPVQYVLQECWFCGFKFYVDQNVLIPRPETEELVEWVISNLKFPLQTTKILDIGSGSGCIPVSLKRKVRKAEMWSCDNSEGALNVARRNAEALGADINYLLLDILDTVASGKLPQFDIIVSNPPYIPKNNKTQLHPNVLEYEPHQALFVPDEDPLLFYKAIAGFGKKHLNGAGAVYAEIHEESGGAVRDVFLSGGYQEVEIKKDMQDKERMIKAVYRP